MLIRLGYDIQFEIGQPVPIVTLLSVHPSRRHDLQAPDRVIAEPGVAGNRVHGQLRQHLYRLLAPPGTLRLTNSTVIQDSGLLDPVSPYAREVPVEELPTEVLRFLMASRFCEVDLLSPVAVELFGGLPRGWARVEGICDVGPFEGDVQLSPRPADEDRAGRVHRADRRLPGLPAPGNHLLSLPQHPGALRHWISRGHRRAGGPRRWISAPGSRSTWRIGGGRSTHATTSPRIGRVLIATGLDATDVAITTSFGSARLSHFEVLTDEIG